MPGIFFPEINQPGRGANHPLPSSSEVRKRVIPLLPLEAFTVCYATNSTCTLPRVMNIQITKLKRAFQLVSHIYGSLFTNVTRANFPMVMLL